MFHCVCFVRLLLELNMEVRRQQQILSSYKEDSYLITHYQFLELLGQGCFGKVFKVINKHTGHQVALKVQRLHTVKLKMVLKNEINILKRLQNKPGVPRIYQHGQWSNGSFLQLQLFQNDLNSFCDYTPNQITDLGIQLINILEGIHSLNVIHQDLKPHNLMKTKEGKLYLIDYGLAKILPIRRATCKVKGFIGTPRYASVRAHCMMQQSKKDDLESAFYNLAYLYYHKLPWSKLNVPNDQRLQKIKLLKIKHKQSLFAEMPPQFQKAFDYITNLEPYAEPDYNLIKGFFKRHRTLIIHPPSSSAILEHRSNAKRISLNTSNFLQVPIPEIFQKTFKGSSQLNIKEITPKNRRKSSLSNHSYGSQKSGRSDAIQMSWLNLYDDKEGQCCNYNEQQNIEPNLPDFRTFQKSLIFKNPFG